MQEKSVVEMAQGAIMERVDLEMGKIIENILDLNTRATEKRKLVISLEFSPDDKREIVQMATTAKCSLAPASPIQTSLYVSDEGGGTVNVVEMVPNIPGQLGILRGEQEEPKILKFKKAEG